MSIPKLLKRDQKETIDLRNKSLLSFKTMIGLVMNKSGSYRDIRLNLIPFGDLLTLLDIAWSPTILKTLKETNSLPMLQLFGESHQHALSGENNKMETVGILLCNDQDSMVIKRSTLL
jgi:hypothetical protein